MKSTATAPDTSTARTTRNFRRQSSLRMVIEVEAPAGAAGGGCALTVSQRPPAPGTSTRPHPFFIRLPLRPCKGTCRPTVSSVAQAANPPVPSLGKDTTAMENAPIGIAVVGYGYWGPNIVRNVLERPEFEPVALCERDESRIADAEKRHPGIECVREFDRVLADPEIEAVAIATPPHTHYDLVRRALEAGKDVLVEKPLARSGGADAEVTALAEELGR